jgi:hypothetical protein
MPGKTITAQQVRLYMEHRKQGETQAAASAKAGLSQRTGRRIETGEVPALEQTRRHWRTRKDPFAEVWDGEVVPLLKKQPALNAITLFEDLENMGSSLSSFLLGNKGKSKGLPPLPHVSGAHGKIHPGV